MSVWPSAGMKCECIHKGPWNPRGDVDGHPPPTYKGIYTVRAVEDKCGGCGDDIISLMEYPAHHRFHATHFRPLVDKDVELFNQLLEPGPGFDAGPNPYEREKEKT